MTTFLFDFWASDCPTIFSTFLLVEVAAAGQALIGSGSGLVVDVDSRKVGQVHLTVGSACALVVSWLLTCQLDGIQEVPDPILGFSASEDHPLIWGGIFLFESGQRNFGLLPLAQTARSRFNSRQVVKVQRMVLEIPITVVNPLHKSEEWRMFTARCQESMSQEHSFSNLR